MADENKRYPRGYSNRELEVLIDKYGDLKADNATFGPAYFAKAALGLTELERRSNGRFAWASLVIALMALILSGVATFFALQTLNDDAKWSEAEIRLLTALNNKIDKSTSTPAMR